MPLSVAAIQHKAKSLFDDLQREWGENSEFSASKGCFMFKEHHRVPHFKMNSSEPGHRDKCPEQLRAITADGLYSPQQVFNVYETGLYWKRLPKGTLSAAEETEPGLPASKDRLMVLLGCNAAGDFKLQPLLVYGVKSPPH